MSVPVGVVLDVNETLFALETLDMVFDDAGLEGKRDLWFARTLRNGFALSAAGRFRSFPDVAREAFVSLAPERLGLDDANALMSAFADLQPHPEVAAALKALKSAGARTVTLSVGNAANVERLFEQSGMAGLVDQHLSCDQVNRWKPAPEPYLYACEALNQDPASVWMIAAHAWDLTGAKAVDMKTAWVSRLEKTYDTNFAEPDITGSDLVDVVSRLLDG